MNVIKSSPARLYAVVAASVALVAHYVPSLPVVLVLALAAAVLGVGEVVQRTEDRKTAEALAQPAPVEPAGYYDPHQDDHQDQAETDDRTEV
ncbi:hypothetical protein OG401_23420 [Kitasatospora purpeofusca]|uniref:hypothetical protein n=1 Tax=Kitasatospora purpeofusca TaxID=67352 RepID=UPI00224EC335|nr:hypothetical protein [Kitasatospora purpeofusca]MCX4687218.1 hypothetical protein [Kitasatospora purpeofusca]